MSNRHFDLQERENSLSREKERVAARRKKAELILQVGVWCIIGSIILIVAALWWGYSWHCRKMAIADYRYQVLATSVDSANTDKDQDNALLKVSCLAVSLSKTSQTEDLWDKLDRLKELQEKVSVQHSTNLESLQRFIQREAVTVKKCREEKANCGIKEYDERRIMACQPLSLSLQELNKITRYKKQLDLNRRSMDDMLEKIGFLQRSIGNDIDFINATGNSCAEDTVQAVDQFLKDFNLPPAEMSKINLDNLPPLNLRDVWNLINDDTVSPNTPSVTPTNTEKKESTRRFFE